MLTEREKSMKIAAVRPGYVGLLLVLQLARSGVSGFRFTKNGFAFYER